MDNIQEYSYTISHTRRPQESFGRETKKIDRGRFCKASLMETAADGRESKRRCGRAISVAKDHPDQINLCTDHGEILSHMSEYWDRHKDQGCPEWVENLMKAQRAHRRLPSDCRSKKTFRQLYYVHKPQALRIRARRSKTKTSRGVSHARTAQTRSEMNTEEHGMALSRRRATAIRGDPHGTDPNRTEQMMVQSVQSTPNNVSSEGLDPEQLDTRIYPDQDPSLVSKLWDVHDRQMYGPANMSNNRSTMYNTSRDDWAVPPQVPTVSPLQNNFATGYHPSDSGEFNAYNTVPVYEDLTFTGHVPSEESLPRGYPSELDQHDPVWVESHGLYSQDIAFQLTQLGSSGHQDGGGGHSSYSGDPFTAGSD